MYLYIIVVNNDAVLFRNRLKQKKAIQLRIAFSEVLGGFEPP